MSDAELYSKCKHFGEITRKYRAKFAGLLPEVARRKLYEKKGFSSIFEFAAKLAGMSEKQVRRVLNLERKFEERGAMFLKTMLVEGNISASKLERVAAVADSNTDLFWANQAKLLPQKALETLVRDVRWQNQNTDPKSVNQTFDHDGLLEPKNGQKSVRAHTPTLDTEITASDLGLSTEATKKLFELKRRGININQLLLEFLDQREREIDEEKNCMAEQIKQQQELEAEAELHNIPIENSRYIPAKIRNLLKKEFGDKCAVPTCSKNAEEIHHANRFAISKNHNPYFLAPLCAEHHKIAHTIDWQFHDARLKAVG